MLFFLIIKLQFVDHMYQYSLESFLSFYFKAIEQVQDSAEQRITKLVQNIRLVIYQWIS